MRNAASAVIVTLLLTACAFEPLVWTHPNYGLAEYDRDSAQCRYEARHATESYTTVYTARGAAALGLSEGTAAALHEGEVVSLCMRARGWYQVRTSAFVYKQPPVPLPSDPVPRTRPEYTLPLPPSGEAATSSTPAIAVYRSAREQATGGRWRYMAENVTAFYFPCDNPRAYLVSSDVRTEFYEVTCAGAPMSIPIQCDYGECALQ